MNSPDWYFAQAEDLRRRADVCWQLAQHLEGAALFDLHRYSGDATWQCPAATEFDEQLAVHCSRLHDAIDRLRSNALGLSADADDAERQGTHASVTEVVIPRPNR